MRTLTIAFGVLLLIGGSTDAAPAKAQGIWALRMIRPSGYTPRVAVAIVNLEKDGKTWSGDLTWRPPMMGGATLQLSAVEVDGKEVRFRFPSGDGEAVFDARLASGVMQGKCTWGGSTHPFEASPHRRFEDKKPKRGFFDRGDPKKLGLDANQLGVLVETADVLDTDALVILKDGKVAVERYYGGKARRIHIMSCTKFLTAMAVALLIEDEKIESLDAPLSTWFPDWKEGRKGKVTLRHVLAHTSGIERRKMAHELNKQRNKVKFVREGPMTDEPGTKFIYNNEAIALLSGVITPAAGTPCDIYLKKKLFEPMKIKEWAWDRDGAGNTITYAQLGMTGRDLAKVGQLIVDDGKWAGKSLFPSKWIETLGTRGSELSDQCGLIWWLRRSEDGKVFGYYHTGSLGQYFMIYPEAKLVAVRLRRGEKQGREFEWGNFIWMLERCFR